jgi:Flagellar biosynthesis protein, FliO
MSSPLRIYYSYSQSLPEHNEDADSGVSSSFASTLHAVAEQQKSDSYSPSRLSVVPQAKSRRPKVIGTPLTVGGRSANPEPVKTEAPLQTAEPVAVQKQQAPPTGGLLSRAWSWLQSRHKFSSAKQLRVSETVPLGDKRFVALVSVDGQKFLIGGGASGVCLLTPLSANEASAPTPEMIASAAEARK